MHIKGIAKSRKKVENDPSLSEEERQLQRDIVEDLNIGQHAKLKILSQNWIDLTTFSWQSCWTGCWTFIGFSCFCCSSYWGYGWCNKQKSRYCDNC